MVLAVELESAPVAASCMEGRPSHTVSSACSVAVADAQSYKISVASFEM